MSKAYYRKEKENSEKPERKRKMEKMNYFEFEVYGKNRVMVFNDTDPYDTKEAALDAANWYMRKPGIYTVYPIPGGIEIEKEVTIEP